MGWNHQTVFYDLHMGFVFNLVRLLAVTGFFVLCLICLGAARDSGNSFCFRHSFNSVNGCVEAHRKQLLQKRPSEKVIWLIYRFDMFVRFLDPWIAIHKFLLVSKAWFNLFFSRCFQAVGDMERNSEALPYFIAVAWWEKIAGYR